MALLGTSLAKGFSRLKSIDDARAKLSGLGHDAGTVDKIMENALTAVKGTSFGMGDAASAAAGMVASGVKPGVELTRTLSLMGDAATIAGTGLGDMSSIFGKVAAGGKVTGEVVAQLSDRGVPVLQLLGKQLGVTAGEARDMVSAGQVDFAAFEKAIESGMGGAAQKSGQTFTGAMANAGAALSRVGAALLGGTGGRGGVFSMIPAALGKVIEWLDLVTPAAAAVGDAIGDALGWVSDQIGGLFRGDGAGTSFFDAIATTLREDLIPAAQQAWSWISQNLLPVFAQIADIIVNRVVPIIVMLATWLATKLLPTVFGIYAAVAKNLMPVFKALAEYWQNTVLPIVDQLLAKFREWWPTISTVIIIAFKLIGVFWKIASVILGVVLPPLIKIVGFLIKVFFKTLIFLIDIVVKVIASLIRLGKWVSVVFKAIGNAVRFAWQKVVRPAFSAWRLYIDHVLAPIFRFLWAKVVRPVFRSIGETIRSTWTNTIRPVFTALKNFITDTVVPAFRRGVDAIKTIWESLKAAARKPVEFLVNTVYTKGIRAMMNKIPGVNLPAASFARGGIMPGYTPGRDVHTFYSPTGGMLRLSGGEAVMRPEFVRAVGGARGIDRLNRAAQSFARGGVVMPLAGAHMSTYAGHDGVDLNTAGEDYGLPIRAFRAGSISYVGTGAGYGLAVFEAGPWGTVVYGHMSRAATRTGANVSAGQVIGYVGSTGNSSGPHLHFGIPGSTYSAAVALLGGATNVFGGARASFNANLRSSAAQIAGERRESSKKDTWLSAIRSLPALARSMWGSIGGLGDRFGEWGQVLRTGTVSVLRTGVGWLDDKIPDKIALKWLPDLDLPDTPVHDVLAKIGVFDAGGVLAPGALAYNASRRPEAVFNARQLDRLAEGGGGAGGRSYALTITNWEDGTGYLEAIADDRVAAADSMAAQSLRAGSW